MASFRPSSRQRGQDDYIDGSAGMAGGGEGSVAQVADVAQGGDEVEEGEEEEEEEEEEFDEEELAQGEDLLAQDVYGEYEREQRKDTPSKLTFLPCILAPH